MVPSGASTGTKEAVELRDGDKTRYLGKGVQKAVANVNGDDRRGAARASMPPTRRASTPPDRPRRHREQGPPRRQRAAGRVAGECACRGGLEGLAAVATWHLAGSRAPVLPVPMMNIINGGAHADNNVDLQEFMVLPVGFDSFSEALRAGTEIFHALKSVLKAPWPEHGGRRRRRLRARPDQQRGSAGNHPRSDRQGRLQGRRRTCCSASTWPPASSSRTASTTWWAKASA
jgi:enolase